jgi:hypothetical protein
MIRDTIPILSAVCTALGLGGLWWYYSLSSEEERARANELANAYAWQLYQKSAEELSRQQLNDIHDRVRRQFGS